MADLNKIKPKSETIVVELKLDDEVLMNDPVGKAKPTPMTLTLNSPTSKAFRETQFDLQDELLERYRKGNDAEKDMTAREIFAARVDKLSKNTIDWDITLNGKPKFSQDAVREFYTQWPIFFSQAEDALNKDVGFTLA